MRTIKLLSWAVILAQVSSMGLYNYLLLTPQSNFSSSLPPSLSVPWYPSTSLQRQFCSHHLPFPNKVTKGLFCLSLLLSQSTPRINLFTKGVEIFCPPCLPVKLPLPWNHSALHCLAQYQYFIRNICHSVGPHLPPLYHHQKHIMHPLPQRERY